MSPRHPPQWATSRLLDPLVEKLEVIPERVTRRVPVDDSEDDSPHLGDGGSVTVDENQPFMISRTEPTEIRDILRDDNEVFRLGVWKYVGQVVDPGLENGHDVVCPVAVLAGIRTDRALDVFVEKNPQSSPPVPYSESVLGGVTPSGWICSVLPRSSAAVISRSFRTRCISSGSAW